MMIICEFVIEINEILYLVMFLFLQVRQLIIYLMHLFVFYLIDTFA